MRNHIPTIYDEDLIKSNDNIYIYNIKGQKVYELLDYKLDKLNFDINVIKEKSGLLSGLYFIYFINKK